MGPQDSFKGFLVQVVSLHDRGCVYQTACGMQGENWTRSLQCENGHCHVHITGGCSDTVDRSQRSEWDALADELRAA